MKRYEREAEDWVANLANIPRNQIVNNGGALYAKECHIAGYLKAREEAAAYCRDYRRAYDESIFPPMDMEQFDPMVRTIVAGRMGRFVLDNAIGDLSTMGEEEEEG